MASREAPQGDVQLLERLSEIEQRRLGDITSYLEGFILPFWKLKTKAVRQRLFGDDWGKQLGALLVAVRVGEVKSVSKGEIQGEIERRLTGFDLRERALRSLSRFVRVVADEWTEDQTWPDRDDILPESVELDDAGPAYYERLSEEGKHRADERA